MSFGTFLKKAKYSVLSFVKINLFGRSFSNGVKLNCSHSNTVFFAGKYGWKNICLRLKGKNNSLSFGKNLKSKYIDIYVRGENNSISIGDNLNNNGHFEICVIGANNSITIGDNVLIVNKLSIYNLDNSQNCRINIGNFTSFYKTEISTYDNESTVQIGEDCMFGFDTIIYNTDGHSIFQDGKLINRAKDLVIGNHCWCGWGSTILKNTHIADGCIVGKSAVVSGNFSEEKSAIVGVPAKVIKNGIEWNRNSVNQTLMG